MKKAFLFSTDRELLDMLSPSFKKGAWQMLPPTKCVPDYIPPGTLVVIDTDVFKRSILFSTLSALARRFIPVACICSEASGPETLQMLNKGAGTVLFRSDPSSWPRELRRLQLRIRQAAAIRKSMANEAKTSLLLKTLPLLAADNSIETNLRTILESLRKSYPESSVYLFLAAKNRMNARIIVGPDCSGLGSIEFDLLAPPAWLAEVIKNKEKKHFRFLAERKSFPETGLVFPLLIKQQFSGVIVVTCNQTCFSPQDFLILEGFSELSTLALENGKLFRDVIRTRERLIKQEKKNLLAQMVVSLNHEINNPLSIISMETQLLERDLNGDKDNLSARLNKINCNVQRIQKILQRISALRVENYESVAYTARKAMIKINEN